MLQMRTGPVRVDGYGTYTRNGEELKRGDGSPAEKCVFRVEGEELARELPIDRSVNGQRPDPGTVCELVLESFVRTDAAMGRNNVPYVRRVVKHRIVGFATAKAS